MYIWNVTVRSVALGFTYRTVVTASSIQKAIQAVIKAWEDSMPHKSGIEITGVVRSGRINFELEAQAIH